MMTVDPADLVFTDLAERALHDHHGFAIDDAWWACEQPEKPTDDLTLFDVRCRACALALWASIKQNGAEVAPFMTVHGEAKLAPNDVVTREALRRFHGVEV